MKKKVKQTVYEKRQITFQEYAALLAVRELLRAKVIKPLDRKISPHVRPDDKYVLNMHIVLNKRKTSNSECGSIGCIGGYMGMVMGQGEQYMNSNYSQSLDNLFYPECKYDWDFITPTKAILAIDNWLKTGNPRWDKIGLKLDPDYE